MYCLKLGSCEHASRNASPREVDWIWADVSSVQRFFSPCDVGRTFTSFLRKGFTGLVFHRGEDWIAYGWMANPWTDGPRHLPKWVGDLGVYWIFYCRTRENFRGRGLYTSALRHLVGRACQGGRQTSILVDTDSANIPSRRAIMSAGFHPKGAIVTYTIQIPRLGRRVWGNWDSEFVHPPMPEHLQTRIDE